MIIQDNRSKMLPTYFWRLKKGTCFKFFAEKTTYRDIENGQYELDHARGIFMAVRLPQGTWSHCNAYINLATGDVVDLRGDGYCARAAVMVKPINIVAEEQ